MGEAGSAVRVCIVTGLSGAGKSTALQVFEDLRHFTVDGLPASMAPEMAGMMERPSMAHFRGMALGMDMRQNDFPEEMREALETLRARGVPTTLLFLEAETPELIRRYATTRRPHPLERSGVGLEAALSQEIRSLAPLRELADIVLDTTHLSIHDLRRTIQKRWRHEKGQMRGIRVNIISFGFKYGVPREADMVMDLRFLPNPFFVEGLRPLSGKDRPVVDYILSFGQAAEFRTRLLDLLLFMLPQMEAEGRYRVAVALGCTGGRHRSVAMAEEIHAALRQAGYPVSVEHRHLEFV